MSGISNFQTIWIADDLHRRPLAIAAVHDRVDGQRIDLGRDRGLLDQAAEDARLGGIERREAGGWLI